MINHIQRFNNQNKKQGFALLIGVLITAILISISYSMFGVTLKQSMLSVAGKDSQRAFYISDTGLECALYADYNITNEEQTDGKTYGAFATTDASVDASDNVTLTLTAPLSSLNGFQCNEHVMSVVPPGCVNASTGGTPCSAIIFSNGIPTTYSYPNAVVSRFRVDSKTYSSDPSCAIVTVVKYKVQDGTKQVLKTEIKSRGYNTCTNDNLNNDPQRLERGLEVYY